MWRFIGLQTAIDSPACQPIFGQLYVVKKLPFLGLPPSAKPPPEEATLFSYPINQKVVSYCSFPNQPPYDSITYLLACSISPINSTYPCPGRLHKSLQIDQFSQFIGSGVDRLGWVNPNCATPYWCWRRSYQGPEHITKQCEQQVAKI